MSDLIERQDALDALEREKTYSRAYNEGYTQTDPFEQYNMGLIDGIKALKRLPSAQPEIIYCRDCKHHSHDAGYGHDWCNRMSGVFRVKPDDFCSRAERRTDEPDR